tara:strand:+ start:313 stop:1962 length:1650 start_codon:yes stop_codon:yes gene_type:complete
MAYTTNYSFKRFDPTGSIMYVVVNILNDSSTVVETIDSFPIKIPIDSNGAATTGAALETHVTNTLASVFDGGYLQQRKYQYDNGNVVTNASLIYTLTSEIEAGEAVDQIIGFVFDASGNPISGVTVTSSGGGSGTTDISGGFLFAATAGAQKVTASKTGYFDNFKMITVGGTTNMNIVLQTQTGIQSSVPLTGLTSGTVTGTGTGRPSNNAEVSFPANAIVDGGNNPVASATMKIGNILVSDTGATDIFPGTFLGEISGSDEPIESYGYVNVSVEDGSGNSLSLNPAIGATVRMPVNPDPVGENTIATWRLNETTGVWEQGSNATRVGASNVFEFNVTSFSWWNIDKPIPVCCTLTVTVYADTLGAVFANGVDVTVNVTPTNWGSRPTIWQGRGTTNSNGQVTMKVPPGILEVVGKRGSTTYIGTGYETSGTPSSCLASMSLYPQYDWNNPFPPAPPALSISYPGTLNLNQAKTISWAGGRQSNTIIMERFDPINETFNSQTLVSNSILVSGSVSFTPTVAGEVHVFIIQATDANGDVYTAQTPGVVPT